ncbi:MarR family winged helix-turn-helix transcriptional regulator [Listeria costaricensis]|uniref:MarR family winged helix-turn-helix transcriptional regulator n=1 Tax=Listeria costaricensis TaxID=2026604 RepID=UPI000C06EE9B|nr:MarR family transcriptional regulator [Listeria costaricensis]
MEELWSLYKRVIYRIGIGDFTKWVGMHLSMPQMKTLLYLMIEGETPMRILADQMETSMPNMNGITNRLEAAELVVRYNSEKDRRVTLIALSEKAAQLFNEALDGGLQNLSTALQKMTPTERATVLEAFQLLEKHLEPQMLHPHDL